MANTYFYYGEHILIGPNGWVAWTIHSPVHYDPPGEILSIHWLFAAAWLLFGSMSQIDPGFESL